MKTTTSPLRSRAVADFVVCSAFELLDLTRDARSERTRVALLEIFDEACFILGDLAANSDRLAIIPVVTHGSADAKLRILLVHGTWARQFFPRLRRAFRMRGTWFEEPSHFCEKLRTSAILSIDFSAFLWSGSNSAGARHEAALKLSRIVEENILRNSADQHVIIAHSHGGNVALQAMHYLGPLSSRVLLITLATPFLQIFQNNTDLQFRWISALTYVVGAFFIVSVLFFGRDMIHEPQQFIIAGLLCLSIVWCYYRAARILFGVMCDRKYSTTTINVLQERTNYKINGQQRILVLRGVSDEASLSLAVGSAIGTLSRYLSIIVTRFGRLMFSLLLFVSVIGGPYEGGGLERFGLRFYGWSFVLLLIILLLRVLAALGRLVFGSEMLFLMEGYEIDASVAPDSAENVRLVTVAPTFLQKGLRHRLYDNPDAVKAMARWLYETCGRGDYPLL